VPKEILTRFVPRSEKNRKRFEAWDTADPVDDREREWVRRIEAMQGNANLFVKYQRYTAEPLGCVPEPFGRPRKGGMMQRVKRSAGSQRSVAGRLNRSMNGAAGNGWPVHRATTAK
jgi:hypothetical protein